MNFNFKWIYKNINNNPKELPIIKIKLVKDMFHKTINHTSRQQLPYSFLKQVKIKKHPNPYKIILHKLIYKKEKKQNQWSYFFSSMLPFLFKNDSYDIKLLNEEEFVSKYININNENR